MSFQGFARLAARCWYVFVALPIAMLGICFAMEATGAIVANEYTATSSILVNSEQYVVYGIAVDEVEGPDEKYEGLKLQAQLRESKSTIEIKATGKDPELSVLAVNDIAETTVELAKEFIVESSVAEGDSAFDAQIINAESAAKISRGKMYAFAFFAIGILAAFCVLLAIGLVKQYVISKDDVSRVTGYPVFNNCGSLNGARLLVDLDLLVGNGGTQVVCVLPLRDDASSQEVGTELEAAAKDASASRSVWTIRRLPSPLCDPSVLLQAKECDFTVLVVSQWTDRIPDLECVLCEFALAKMENVGIAFEEKKFRRLSAK